MIPDKFPEAKLNNNSKEQGLLVNLAFTPVLPFWVINAFYRMYKKNGIQLWCFITRTKQTSTPSVWYHFLACMVFFLFNEGSLVYFRQITTSAEVIYQKRLFWDASKFVFIYNYVVKHKGRKYRQAFCLYNLPHSA